VVRHEVKRATRRLAARVIPAHAGIRLQCLKLTLPGVRRDDDTRLS
jgi:hypothetical protein